MCGGQLWTSLHDVMWYSESTVLTNRWRLCLKDYRKRESIIIMANTYKNQIRCHNFYSGSDYYWKNINHNRVALQFCAEHLFLCWTLFQSLFDVRVLRWIESVDFLVYFISLQDLDNCGMCMLFMPDSNHVSPASAMQNDKRMMPVVVHVQKKLKFRSNQFLLHFSYSRSD